MRWLWVTLALAPIGCSDEETTAPIGPTGPPAVVLVGGAAEPLCLEVEADGVLGALLQMTICAAGPPCLEVGSEADARVPLLVDATELVLRPPGACAGLVQCGHLRLLADGVLNNEAATEAFDLLLRKLADRYHDGATHPGTGEADLLALRVEVVGDDGAILLDHSGAELAAEVKVRTEAACE